jgi:FKBP-type peptidyl-prolyl cis-trans isomerase SlyD
MRHAMTFTATLVALSISTAFAQAPVSSTAVENGSTVSLEYTLTGEGGEVLDSNKGGRPLVFVQGQQQIIPGLERELVGMRAGEQKKVVVKPEDAYGEVVPNAQQEVPKDAIPKEGLAVGTVLSARSGSGEARPVVVKEIKENTVVLDVNHPLAGKTLYFDVKVLDIRGPRP